MQPPAATDRRDLWCMALLAAVATIFFADVLFAGANFYYRDLFIYHFPLKRIVREAMLSGEFPFWSRYLESGQPLAANPAYELFYPPQWLILAGSYAFGFALHILFHVYAALIGAYLLFREMLLGRAASVFGALSFGMGGLLLGSMPMLPTFFVWALAPIVAWSVLRVLRQPSPARFAVAALLAGMQLIVAEPMSIVQVWVLIGCGALLFSRRRAIPVIAIVGLLAVTVAAVQIIPAIDHARHSARSRGLDFDVVKQYAMPPTRPIELAVPHFFGMFDPMRSEFWGSAAFDRGVPYLFSLYDGIFVAILALAGFLLRARGTLTVAILSVVSYVLAIGDRTPVLRMLYDSGIARGIRYPEKFAALGVVALTVFAVTIADRVLSGEERARKAATIAGVVVTLISASVLFSAMRPQWVMGAIIAAAATAMIVLRGRVTARLWLLLAFTLVLLDLALVGNDIVTRMPAEYFTPPDVVRSFDRDRDAYAVMHRGEWMHEEANFHQLRGAFGPWFGRNGLEPLTPASWGLRSALELDFDETALLPTHDLLDALMKLGNRGYPRWAESFAALSNVRYIIDYRPLGEVLARSRDTLVRITKLPSTGRYYFPEQVIAARTPDDVVNAIANGQLRRPTAFVAFAAPTPARARVERVIETSNTATIDVDCASEALLVLTVTRDRNWRATIDGHPAALLPVNIAYQGVVVPAGRHRIEMRYRNPVVVAGGVISLIAIAACAAAIATAPIRRRRRLRSGS